MKQSNSPFIYEKKKIVFQEKIDQHEKNSRISVITIHSSLC